MKVFRRLRIHFLDEGKSGKYLRYAIGEIVLVVIGILLALSINNWNTQRIEGKQEKQILQQIRAEYEDNKAQLLSKMEGRFMINKAASKLLEYHSKPSTIDPDSLAIYIAATMFRPTFDPATGVMDELVNSGKLYLIKNDSLRVLLSNWYVKYFIEVREEEQVAMDFVESQYVPYLIQKYQVRNAHYSLYLQSPLDILWFSFDKEQYQSILGPSSTKDDGKLLINDALFENYISTLIINHTVANNQSVGVLDRMNEILALIDQELEK